MIHKIWKWYVKNHPKDAQKPEVIAFKEEMQNEFRKAIEIAYRDGETDALDENIKPKLLKLLMMLKIILKKISKYEKITICNHADSYRLL